MRLVVCGGRRYSDVVNIWRRLDELNRDCGGIRCIIDGASDDVTGPYVGADYWGHQWALARDKPYERFHAFWKAMGRAAGPSRNRRMLIHGKPDKVAAFPGGNGTRDMIRQAQEFNIEVFQFT